MISTKQQFIDHCVARGRQANIATATWHEYLAEGPDGDENLWQDGQIVEITEIAAIQFYQTFASMCEITDEGMLFDGELAFNLQGDRI